MIDALRGVSLAESSHSGSIKHRENDDDEYDSSDEEDDSKDDHSNGTTVVLSIAVVGLHSRVTAAFCAAIN